MTDDDFPRGAGDPDFYGYPGQVVETPPKMKYICSVCGKPNNYWWLYCEKHENQVDREMEPEL